MYEKRNREQEREEALRLKGVAAGMAPRCCAFAGCDQPGLYRAPCGRERLREFQWLCLEHVREFNKGWDFFQGMSQAQIDRHRRDDVTWHRPTWRFGTAYAFGPAFGFVADFAQIEVAVVIARIFRQPDIGPGNLVAVSHDDGPLDAVFKFTDIARPGVGGDRPQGVVPQSHGATVLFSGKSPDKGVGEQGRIPHPGA